MTWSPRNKPNEDRDSDDVDDIRDGQATKNKGQMIKLLIIFTDVRFFEVFVCSIVY